MEERQIVNVKVWTLSWLDNNLDVEVFHFAARRKHLLVDLGRVGPRTVVLVVQWLASLGTPSTFPLAELLLSLHVLPARHAYAAGNFVSCGLVEPPHGAAHGIKHSVFADNFHSVLWSCHRNVF